MSEVAPRVEPSMAEFARLTALNVLATLTVPIASLVDTAMLGHLPVATALAGAALGALVFDYIFWGLGFLRMATTGLAAGALGRAEHEELAALLVRAALLGATIGLGLVLLRPVIVALAGSVLPGDHAVVDAAAGYVGARLWGAPATLTNFALTGWLLGTGRSGRALLIASVANLGNAALNVVFIWWLGLGATGAGLATACGQWLALLAVVPTLFAVIDRRPRWALVFDRAGISALFSLGADITIRTICLVTAMSLFTGAGALWGAAVLAGQAVLMRILGVFSYVIDGAAQAVEALAGRAHATGDDTSATRVVRWGYAVSVGCVVVLGGSFWAFPGQTVGLLTDLPAVREHVFAWLPITLGVAFVGGFAYVLDGLFVGIAAGRALRNAMLVSFFVAFVPAFVVGVLLEDLRVLWGAMALFMIARALTLRVAWTWSRARPNSDRGGPSLPRAERLDQ